MSILFYAFVIGYLTVSLLRLFYHEKKIFEKECHGSEESVVWAAKEVLGEEEEDEGVYSQRLWLHQERPSRGLRQKKTDS